MGSAAASVRAGANGAFRFEPPVSGTWTLAAATAPGFLPFAPEWETSPFELDARRGARVSGIDIVLRPAMEYRGEVLLNSTDGLPEDPASLSVRAAGYHARIVEGIEVREGRAPARSGYGRPSIGHATPDGAASPHRGARAVPDLERR